MLISLFLTAQTGCAPPPYTAPSTDSSIVADTNPTITLTWPPPETTAVGCVVVTTNITNFVVRDYTTTDGLEEAGHGHWHVLHPEGPSGYDICSRPYCVAHFETMDPLLAGLTDLSAQLVYDNHSPVLNDAGEPVIATLPINFSPGDCVEGLGSEPYDTGADTAAMEFTGG